MENKKQDEKNIAGFSFKIFESPGKYNPTISLGKSKRFGLSTSFLEKHKLLDTKSVRLMYDDAKNAIAFLFFKEGPADRTTQKVVVMNVGGAYVNAKSFLGINNINAEQYMGRYEPQKIKTEDGDVYIIELKEKQQNIDN